MGLLRYGDPIDHPETDVRFSHGVRWQLDSIWTSPSEMSRRIKQLEANGEYADYIKREALPEEAKEHFDYKDMSGRIYPDGRTTTVWEVWVKRMSKFRKKSTKSKTKVKRCSCKKK